jgi:hypothetical protein
MLVDLRAKVKSAPAGSEKRGEHEGPPRGVHPSALIVRRAFVGRAARFRA